MTTRSLILKRRVSTLLVFALALAAGCEIEKGVVVRPDALESIFVDAGQYPCSLGSAQTCYDVWRATGPWTKVPVGRIEGFKHDIGFRYELLVEVIRVSGDEADGDAEFRYRVISVLERLDTRTMD